MTDRIVRALVTGASSGLGESFARQLADRRVELVIVARDRDRLEGLAARLPVATEILPADLADPGQLATVEARLEATEMPVDLLVNNAGFGAYGPVVDQAPEELSSMIAVNANAVVRLSRAVLPQLLARGTGGLIQMGSTTAYQPNPYTATYGATKAFVRSFTEALHGELTGTGVHAMLLSPGSTRTRFHDRADVVHHPFPEPAHMTADEVVAAALHAFASGRRVCIPGALNAAGAWGADLAPSALGGWISGIVHRRFRTRS